MFEWSADTGAAHSGTGASSWAGVASHSATIEVTVDNEDRLSRLVDVEARRQNFGIGQLNAQVEYTAEPRRQAIAKLGFYKVDTSNYRVRGAQGTGPWEGWFMSHDRALPIVGLDFIGVLHVAEDYKPGGGGPKYPGAHSTCAAAAGLPPDSDYTAVNDKCSTLATMERFRNQIIAHERVHEAGYNACLSSSTAATFLKKLEELVHKDAGKWTTEALLLVNPFRQKLDAAGKYAPTFTSQGPFWQNYGIWQRQGLTSAPHAHSRQGC